MRPVVTVFSSYGGHLKTGFISGSCLCELWPSMACCFICWQFGSFRGMLCLERKGERKTESRIICCLFCCSGRLVSPKWKNFKGLKLQWRDKIRLNNAIWRAWYMQCKYRAGGGSSLRHRWERENWNYCLVKSSGICSRSDVPEPMPLDQGFPGCAHTEDVPSAPSTAQDLPVWCCSLGGNPG